MKRNSENGIDRMFRQGLENAPVQAPARAWRNIAAEVGGSPKRRKGGWFFISIAAAAMLFAAVGVWQGWFVSGTQNEGMNFSKTEQENLIQSENKENVPLLTDGGKENKKATSENEEGNADVTTHPKQAPVMNSPSNNRRANPLVPVKDFEQMHAPDQPKITPEGDFTHQEPLPNQNETPLKERKAPKSYQEMLRMEVPGSNNQKGNFANNHQNNSLETPLPKFEEPGNSQEDRWLIAGNFGPDFNVSNQFGARGDAFMYNEDQNSLSGTPDHAVKSESSTAYSTGVRVGYALNQRIQLQSGANYASRSGEISQGLDPNVFSGLTPLSESATQETNYSIRMIEIPVLMRYDLISGEKIRYFVSSGMSTQWLLSYKETVTGPMAEQNDFTGSRSAPEQVNVLVGTGLEILPIEQVGIQIEPLMRYGALYRSYTDGAGRPLSLSLNTGLNFRF